MCEILFLKLKSPSELKSPSHFFFFLIYTNRHKHMQEKKKRQMETSVFVCVGALRGEAQSAQGEVLRCVHVSF